jgi:hypothetical protein
MRAERHAVGYRAVPQADDPVGWASRIRSISFVEMGRSAAIILNEVVIFACQILGR